MRSMHVAMLAFALGLPLPSVAQSGAVQDTTQPAPKKHGGLCSGGGRPSISAFAYDMAYRPSSRVSLTGARSSGRLALSKVLLAR